MKLDIKMSKVFLLSLVIVACTSESEAGTVKIINNSDENIRVDVVSDPGSASICKTCLDSCLQTCGKQTATIIVPLDAVCNSFSLIDAEGGFLGSGKCKHLSVFKNYEVSFFTTILGTRCAYKEI
jgi:hypothetical protein